MAKDRTQQNRPLEIARSVGQLKQTFDGLPGLGCVEGVTGKNFTGQTKQHGVGSHFGTGQSGYFGATLGNVGLEVGKDGDAE